MEKRFLNEWRFSKQEEKEAWKKDFDDSTWEKVTIPHDWGVSYPFEKHFSSGTGYLPGGIGWYRTKQSLQELGDLTNKVVKIHFEGVYKNARVWINGYHMGMRPSGYASFYYDLTEILTYNSDDSLLISVRVEHTDLADSRWYNGNGITRPVSLEIHDSIYIDEYGTSFSTPCVTDQQAELVIEHRLVNTLKQDRVVTIEQMLESLQTEKVRNISQEIQLNAGERRTVTLKAKIEKPELWSPEVPNLYQLRTKLSYQEESLKENESVYNEYVGIRSFQFDVNEGFSLNGQQLKIKGVCLHEDAGSFGTAVPMEVWVRRLIKLKEMGANAIRMAHNPHSFALYRLCDTMGFLVFDEAFDEWENSKNKWWQGHNVYPPKLEGAAEHFPTWYEKDLENMILRNRNHPSIIAWSIGNEIDYPNDPYASPLFAEMTGNNDNSKPEAERIYNPHRPDMRRLRTIAEKLVRLSKTLDPTRPVTLAAAFPELSTKIGLIDHLDVVGYNYKEHLYEEDHRKFPDKPFIGSENSHGFKEWQTANTLPYIAGQFLWTGIDYLGEAHGWPIHGSGAGLLTLAGIEKPSYYKRKSWWSQEPTVYLTTIPYEKNKRRAEWEPTYRKWSYPAEQEIEVRCYTNAKEIRLKVGNLEVPNVRYDDTFGYYVARINYQPKTLSVEAVFEETILHDEIRPEAAPTALVAMNYEIPQRWREKLAATDLTLNKNLHQIECQVLDYAENPIAAEVMVYLEVENGTLLGLENGDLADTTAYTESFRRTMQGKLLCFVAGARKKETVVTLRSPGLPDTRLILKNREGST